MSNMSEPATIKLKPGKEKIFQRRHPWIYSGALQSSSDAIQPGETVRIIDHHGGFQAWAAFSPHSQIRARVWSWDESEVIAPDLFKERIQNALYLRQNLIESGVTDAYRIIHGESDGLPGLIVDSYKQVLIVQVLSAGIEFWRNEIAEILVDLLGPEVIYERSDAEVRKLEGLEPRTGLIYGVEPDELLIHENGARFLVDIREGHKTGFYLDQRVNRSIIRRLAANRDVLDCFSYTGGFAVNAVLGNASTVTAVEISESTIEIAWANCRLNQIEPESITWANQDVFQFLRTERDRGNQYDLIILDPPKFAPTASHVKKAARGYKDINLQALKLLRPGGLLATFSCSGGLKPDLFQKIVADAALDANANGKIIQWLHQSEDHPVALSFPEGEYLKGLIVQKV